MASFNKTNSTNNANLVLWSFSTKIEKRSDRKSGTLTRGSLIAGLNNLGTTVATGNPFTLLS